MTKRSEWTTRLEQHGRSSKNCWFVTLTYAPKHVPIGKGGTESLFKKDVQLFMKKLRKTQKDKITYFIVGEYGENFSRPHYHALLFNISGQGDTLYHRILKTWNKGLIHIGNVTPASIKYVTKYMIQDYPPESWEIREKPFSLISNGIGKSYVEKNRKWHTEDVSRNYVVKEGGIKTKLPRYYRDNLYSKYQRQKQNLMFQEMQPDETLEEQKENLRLEHDKFELVKKRAKSTLKQNNKL